MEVVSTIINFVIIWDRRLGWELLIDWKLGKDSVTEEVSTIRNLVVTGAGILYYMGDWSRVTKMDINVDRRSGAG